MLNRLQGLSGGNFATTLSLFSEMDKADNALSVENMSPNEKIKFVLNSRLKNIDRLLKDKSQNKFKLKSEAKKFEDILAKLNETPDLSGAYGAVKSQLALIREEIEKPGVTIQQLENYFRIANKYADLSKEIMDETELLDENIELENESSELLKKINRMLMDSVKEIAAKKGVVLTDADLTRIEETNWAASRALDITADKNTFVQYVAKVVLDAAAKRDITLKNRMDILEEKRKKLGNNEKERLAKAQKILRPGKFNQLIDRYSAAYYEKVSEFYDRISKAKKAGEPTTTIYQERNKWNRDNTVSIDPQIFLGSAENKEAKIQELVAKLGDRETVDKLVNKAEKKYEQYKNELQAYTDYVQSEDSLDDSAKQVLINEFIVTNSPDVYYGIFYANMFKQYEAQYNITGQVDYSQKYIVSAPLRLDNNGKDLGLYDSTYDSMRQDENLYEYYREVVSIMQNKDLLPDYVKEDSSGANYVFATRKKLLENAMDGGVKSFFNQLGNNVVNAMTTEFSDDFLTETDADGNFVKNVKIGVLRNIDLEIKRIEGKLAKDAVKKNNGQKGLSELEVKTLKEKLDDLKNSYSLDVHSNVAAFLKMSNNYIFMNEVLPETMAGSYIMSKAKEYKIDGSSNNAVNTKARLNYFIEASLFGNSQDVEGQYKNQERFQDNVFDVKDLVGGTSDKKKLAKDLSKQIKQLEPRIKDLYAKKDTQGVDESEAKEINDYLNLVREYDDLGGKRTTLSKIGNTLLAYNGLRSLGYNPFSAISNTITGVLATIIEANAGQHYTNQDFIEASSIVFKSTSNKFATGGFFQNGKSKIENLLNNLGIENSMEGMSNGVKQSFSPYTMMQKTDQFFKSLSVVAIMRSKTNKFNKELKDKNGNSITLFEAFDNNGNWKSELFSDETNFKWNTNDLENGSGTEFIKFRHYLQSIESDMHGVGSDSNKPLLVRKTIVGRMLAQFKASFLGSSIHSRFGEQKYNTFTEEITEGRYRTIYNLVANKEDIGSNYMKRFIKLMFDAKNIENLQEFEIANIKRAKADLAIMAILFSVMALLTRLYLDDDDDKNPTAKLIVNQLYSSFAEQSIYISPSIVKNYTSNILPILSLYQDVNKTMSTATKFFGTGEEEDGERALKNFLKLFPFGKSIVTFNNRSSTMLSDYTER
jgi:hypothetical protein